MKPNRVTFLWSAVLFAVLCSIGSAGAAVTVGGGSQFTFDGVDGPLVPDGTVPANLANAPGALSFAMDSGHQPTHDIPKLNDGVYGNSFSWIGVTTRAIDVGGSVVDTTFAGIDFPGNNLHRISSFAFGRSNRGDEFADRTMGTYYVQLTVTPNPGVDTPDGDWTTIGSIDIDSNAFPNTYRHHYTLDSPMDATGLRIVTPGSGTAIDEIEVYPIPEPSGFILALSSLLSLVFLRRRRQAS